MDWLPTYLGGSRWPQTLSGASLKTCSFHSFSLHSFSEVIRRGSAVHMLIDLPHHLRLSTLSKRHGNACISDVILKVVLPSLFQFSCRCQGKWHTTASLWAASCLRELPPMCPRCPFQNCMHVHDAWMHAHQSDKNKHKMWWNLNTHERKSKCDRDLKCAHKCHCNCRCRCK